MTIVESKSGRIYKIEYCKENERIIIMYADKKGLHGIVNTDGDIIETERGAKAWLIRNGMLRK